MNNKNERQSNILYFIFIFVFVSLFAFSFETIDVCAIENTDSDIGKTAVVNTGGSNLNVRSAKTTNYSSNIVIKLQDGTRVKILSEKESAEGLDWYYIDCGSTRGYAAASYLDIQTENYANNIDTTPIYSTTEAEKIIWIYLKSKGLNDYVIAGIMGNLYAESNLNPKNLQGSYEKLLGFTDHSYTQAVDNGTYKNFINDSAGYGLAQWTDSTRKGKLFNSIKSKGKSIGDIYAQLDFLWNELIGYKSVMSVIDSATSVKEVSDIFMVKFERPYDQSDAAKIKRASYGQKYYDKYAKKGQWIKENNKWYYLKDGAYVKGIQCIESDLFIFDESGAMYENRWLEFNNKWYYLKPGGYMARNEWKNSYYLKDNGICAKSEWIYDKNYNSWFYINDDMKYMQKKWFLYKDSKWYYLKPGGYMARNEWVDSYYLKSDGACARTEWIYDKKYNSWFYINDDMKYMQKKWFLYKDCKWYYLKPGGYMARNEWVDSYYLNSDGIMQTGWQYINNKWYYFDSKGAMETGWIRLKGTWYYLNSEGIMQTGWQYINNKWYYFDSKGAMETGWIRLKGTWYYLNSDGIMQTGFIEVNGVKYYLKSDGALKVEGESLNNNLKKSKGIDVSYHNGVIDWKKVKQSGVEFAIIKVGGRGYGTGKLYDDSQFEANIKGALAAGVKVGVYFYTAAMNEKEAVEEANYTIQKIKGYNITLPVAYDSENYYINDARDKNITKEQRTNNTIAFLETIRKAGYMPMVYSNKDSFNDEKYFDTSRLVDKYLIWFAQYYKASDGKPYSSFDQYLDENRTHNYTYEGKTGPIHMVQFTSSGSISGINTAVDMIISYINFNA
ncbi:MAG: phage tail tip lysozyme [Eubacteriales bacterium]|nr:phage tail tip lysozyme [Eubacteriales bacterium]